MGAKTAVWNALCSVNAAVFEYDTPKIVHIKNKKVGFLNRVVQLAILLYIIVWGIILQKGYQMTGPVTGTITTKLKGASYYNGSFGDYSIGCSGADGDINRTFDVGDYVIPPQEPNSFFVLTNLWQTCDQTQGVCPESPSVYGSDCTTDNVSKCLNEDGTPGKLFEGGNGRTTGDCDNETGQCEIRAWCDVEEENDTITDNGPKIDASEFTVLVKSVIEFPTILSGVRKRNIKSAHDGNFLKTCKFDPSDEDGLYCPIFSLKQIIDMIEPTKTVNWKQTMRNISVKGGVVGLEITWDCDHLEFNLNRCHPKYVAKRYDDPDAHISQGYNFRFARYYTDGSVQKRTLVKAYGILFKIELHGTGGSFDFFTLVLKIGSMIALLGISIVVSDVLVLYVLKKRTYYRENKYQDVRDPISEYEVLDQKDTEERMPIHPGNLQ